MATKYYNVTATSTSVYPVTINDAAILVNELITDAQDLIMIDDLEANVTGFSAVELVIPLTLRWYIGMEFKVIAYPTGTGIDPAEKLVAYNYTYVITSGMIINSDRTYI